MPANDKWVKLHVDFLNSSIMGENILTRDLLKVCWLLAREQDWDGGSFKATPWVLASRSSYIHDEIIEAYVEFGGAESVVDMVIESLDRLIEIGSLEEIGDNRYQIPPEKWDRFQDSPQRMKNRLAQRRFREKKKEEELQVDYGEVTDRLQGDDKGITKGLQGYDLPSVSVSNSNSISDDSPKKVDSIKGGVGGKKKRVAVKPDYSDAFNAFWEQTWRRGNKKAAFAAWEAIEDEDMNAIVAAACSWKVALERRPADKRPHVSTWLNARGWEDDLDAELAKAKGDERQVGKTAPKPTVDQEAAKKRRNRVRQAILKHVIHLKDIEFDEPEVAAIVSGAVDKLNALSVLECESEDARELVEGFQHICDEMLLRIAKGWDPALREEWKKAALANGRTKDAQHRMYNALARRAVRVELGIKDVTDYDWVG